MSSKKRTFTTQFKTKIVLEALKNDRTIAEIATSYNITPKNIHNWQKIFLANAEMAMDPSKVVSEYKDEIEHLQLTNDRYAKIVGKMTVEQEWLEKKLASLDLSKKKQLVESKHKKLSITKQCNLLGLNRSSLYYKPVINPHKQRLKSHIVKVFETIPIYGAIKVQRQLIEDGYSISVNTVSCYRKQLGLKAILAVKPVKTTIANKAHKKYPYQIRGLNINRANQVWSTDITYIRIQGGMVYMTAIIDWYSKAVLAYKVSNTMDTALVMDVLHEALDKYGNPEIFNTDQGSQYTSEIHVQALKKRHITISMDGKGRATDNICIERFWRSAKYEKIYLNEYRDMKTLKTDIDDYIAFYNDKRFHQTLDYKKPMEVYNNCIKQQEILAA